MRQLFNRLRGVSVTLRAGVDRWTVGQLAGMVAVIIGVGMVSVAAAFIIGGLGTTVLCFALAAEEQRAADAAKREG